MKRVAIHRDKGRGRAKEIPNYGLVYPTDRVLQRQLEDLNAMKGLDRDTPRRGKRVA